MEQATFGAGCFWGVEAAFAKVNGVKKTTVGFMGGYVKNPSYREVCTDKTGYAEVLQIEFNPKEVSYKNLLDIFWGNHNPTSLNRQGLDFGTQYRSVIFYNNTKQKKAALDSMKEEQKKHTNKIVTEIIAAPTFYKAEDYHQNYFKKHGKVC